jgi:hypothetical protein
MKRVIVFTTAFLMASTLSLSAADQSAVGSVYVGAGIGIEAVPTQYQSSGTAMSLKVGSKLDYLLPKLGGEIEYTKSIIQPKSSATHKVDVQTVGAYFTYDINFKNSPIFVRPRLGVMLPNSGDKINSRDFGLSSGADLGVSLNKRTNLYLGYTHMGETINNYIAGFEYRF